MEKGTIYAMTEISITQPYEKSISTVIEFSSLWQFQIAFLSTADTKCILFIPWDKFKEIFHENPRKKEYNIPNGAECFADKIEVIDIITF